MTADRWLRLLLPLAAWSCFAPLGAKYLFIGGVALVWAASAWVERRDTGWHLDAPTRWALALWLLLALSAAWSPAPAASVASRLGNYAWPLLLAALAVRCPAELARQALAHIVVASACVGIVITLAASGWLPASSWAWHTSAQAEGNQRIATSLLLAMGVGLAAWFALRPGSGRARPAWAALGALALAGLALQDRRSGMALLPLLAAVAAWSLERRLSRRLLAIGAVLLVAAAAVWQADGVRQRFAEGLHELQAYRPDDHVATSWGQRLRMWEHTAAMVAERPLTGHGVASWQQRWTERVTPGTPLAANTTPHNEYLLLAQQAGLLAPLLWVGWLVAGSRRAFQAGPAGLPALMAMTALAWTGLFNAVLRDAKFGLPLLLLAALGAAAARESPRPPR